jgi:hypothetical protein
LFALVLLLPELARTFGLLGFEQANAVYARLEPVNRRSLVWQSVGWQQLWGGVIPVSMVCYTRLGAPWVPVLAQLNKISYFVYFREAACGNGFLNWWLGFFTVSER